MLVQKSGLPLAELTARAEDDTLTVSQYAIFEAIAHINCLRHTPVSWVFALTCVYILPGQVPLTLAAGCAWRRGWPPPFHRWRR